MRGKKTVPKSTLRAHLKRHKKGSPFPIWERARRAYRGRLVTPTRVADRFGVDRAYACRTLKLLVARGFARQDEPRGPYFVYVVETSPEF